MPEETRSQESEAGSQKAEETQPLAPNTQHRGPSTQPLAPSIQDPLLDLSAPERTVSLRLGEQKIVHVFSRPTVDDWLEYERMLRPTAIFSGEAVETSVAIEKASDSLWVRRILRVEGYPFDVEANWKDRVPLQHRRVAVGGLDQVQAADDQDVLGDSETIAVRLVARWNGAVYHRLVHRFRRPGIEHELRFREATSRRALVIHRIGGRKRPTNEPIEQVTLPSLPTLIALYDELIEETEGYLQSPGGFTSMDVPHKAAAVRALLARDEAELALLEERVEG